MKIFEIKKALLINIVKIAQTPTPKTYLAVDKFSR